MGVAVQGPLVTAILKAHILHKAPHLLSPNSKFTLSSSWVHRFIQDVLHWSSRKGTRAARKVPPKRRGSVRVDVPPHRLRNQVSRNQTLDDSQCRPGRRTPHAIWEADLRGQGRTKCPTACARRETPGLSSLSPLSSASTNCLMNRIIDDHRRRIVPRWEDASIPVRLGRKYSGQSSFKISTSALRG